KRANAWGLHDMLGNVWEWCLDAWDGAATLPGGTDPVGTTGSDRVYRGGIWAYVPAFCRAASRYWYVPGFRGYSLGFRVCAVPVK
ncbi:MAG: formylglycine-generating enzyme family protein, partial [Roseimicrobium sp.]